jgi:glycosyltransferase involved in cell wall biosynthesis
MPKAKLTVAHILPGMYFGGVEVAILRSLEELKENFDYNIYYVRGKGGLNANQKYFLKLIYRIIFKRSSPDIIVTSLWWGHLIGIFLSFFGIKWVCFIHSTGYGSFLDKIITNISLKISDNHFYDSETTKNFFNRFQAKNKFVIPYIFNNNSNKNELKKSPTYDFSWIGRNSEEKRLDLLIRFIKSLQEKSISFKCLICIAGKKHNELNELAKVSDNIIIKYNLDPSEISHINYNSKMFLCLSNYEGFSVATAEAAMRGNFIAARPVGDLPQYLCKKSTVWLTGLDRHSWKFFIDKISSILENDADSFYKRLESRKHIQNLFYNKSYTKSISNAFIEVIRHK